MNTQKILQVACLFAGVVAVHMGIATGDAFVWAPVAAIAFSVFVHVE